MAVFVPMVEGLKVTEKEKLLTPDTAAGKLGAELIVKSLPEILIEFTVKVLEPIF